MKEKTIGMSIPAFTALMLEHYENDEHSRFDHVEHKLSQRGDVHAIMLLDKLIPGDHYALEYVVDASVVFSWKVGDVAKVISAEQVLELVQCGVYIDEDEDLCLGVNE